MNKRLKILILMAVAIFISLILILQPKANAAFSKDTVVFDTNRLGIRAPDSIPENTTVIQFQVTDNSKSYSVQAVGYSTSEFATVSYYLKQALGMQNEANASLRLVQYERDWYDKASKDTNFSESEIADFVEKYNDAVQREQELRQEYSTKVSKAVNDYIDNAIRYPEDSKWISIGGSKTVERSQLGEDHYYMLWLRSVDSSGTIMTTPVLYSPPGTLQVVNFTSPVKTEVIEMGPDDVSNYDLSSYVHYNKGRVDEPTKWTSSDPSIAKVDSYGRVTGLKRGFVLITAENEDSRDVAAVFINAPFELPYVPPTPSPTQTASPTGDTGLTIIRDGSDITISQRTSNLPGTSTTGKGDDTIAKGTYPKAGKICLGFIFVGLIVAIAFVIRQNYKMRDIK